MADNKDKDFFDLFKGASVGKEAANKYKSRDQNQDLGSDIDYSDLDDLLNRNAPKTNTSNEKPVWREVKHPSDYKRESSIQNNIASETAVPGQDVKRNIGNVKDDKTAVPGQDRSGVDFDGDAKKANGTTMDRLRDIYRSTVNDPNFNSSVKRDGIDVPGASKFKQTGTVVPGASNVKQTGTAVPGSKIKDMELKESIKRAPSNTAEVKSLGTEVPGSKISDMDVKESIKRAPGDSSKVKGLGTEVPGQSVDKNSQPSIPVRDDAGNKMKISKNDLQDLIRDTKENQSRGIKKVNLHDDAGNTLRLNQPMVAKISAKYDNTPSRNNGNGKASNKSLDNAPSLD